MMNAMRRRNERDTRIPSIYVRKISPAAVKMITRDKALDPRLRAVDYYLQRWSVGQGTGLPMDAEIADGLPPSRPTPLPPEEAIVVDLTILKSPNWYRRFAFMWYRSDKSASQIAVVLKMRLQAVYEERKLVLAYYQGRLNAVGIEFPVWETDA